MKCPICDKQQKEEYIEVFFSEAVNKEYKLYHCSGCGIKFWYPMEIIKELYEKELDKTYIGFHKGIGGMKFVRRNAIFFKKISY